MFQDLKRQLGAITDGDQVAEISGLNGQQYLPGFRAYVH